MTVISTGYIGGSNTGTFVNFPASYTTVDLYVSPHPENRGNSYIISQNGSIGWPLVSGSDPLVLTNVDNVGKLRGWFEVLGDKLSYMIVDRNP